MTSTAVAAPVASHRRVTPWVHMPGLDGVRAIAVVAVLLFHADSTWLPGGFLGVDVFFTLSGFLITSLLLAELDQRGGIRFGRFYLRRGRRLLPALFAVLVVTALLAATIAQDAAARVREDAIAAFLYVTNWWYVVDQTSYFEATGRPPMLQHLWSLAVEEQFYFIWPLLMYGLWRLGGARGVRIGAVVGALASTLAMAWISVRAGIPEGADAGRVYFGTDTHAMTLLVGAALATVWSPGAINARLTRRGIVVVTAVAFASLTALVAIFLLVGPTSTLLFRGGFLVVGLVTAGVVMGAAVSSSVFAKALAVQPLRWLGERSYGIYLWHWPIFLVLRPGIDVDSDGWPVQVARFALTFAVAELSYRWVEMPVRRGVIGDAWRRWRAAGGFALVGRTALTTITATAVVVALGFGLASAHEPTLEDALGGVTAVGDEDLDAIDPIATPDPTGSLSPSATATPSAGASPSGAATTKPSPAASRPGSAPPVVAAGVDAYGLPTTALGDSVMLGARDALTAVFTEGPIVVDAKVSRQAGELIDRVVERKAKGKLGDVVIIHTGTNGNVNTLQLVELLTYLKDRTRVVLVTCRAPRDWTPGANRAIQAAVQRFPGGNVRIADWVSASAGHRDWFYADGIHPHGEGAIAYATLIRDALRK